MSELIKAVQEFFSNPINQYGITALITTFSLTSGIMYLNNKLHKKYLKENNLDKSTGLSLKELNPRFTTQLHKELIEYDETGNISKQYGRSLSGPTKKIYRWTDLVPDATKEYKLSHYKEYDQNKRLKTFFARKDVQSEIKQRTIIGYLKKDTRKIF